MNKNKGFLLILMTAFISGGVVFISKFGVSVVNPYIFTGLKNIVVALLVVCWLLMLKDWRVLKELGKTQWLSLLAVGLVGGSIPFLLYFKGLSMTNAVQAAFIHKTMFVFVALLAVVFLKEKISKNFLIGGLLLFLGNIFLLKILPHQFGYGDLLIFFATLLWASENVLSKHLLKELPARIVIWGRMFFGSIFIILFLLATGQFNLLGSLNLEQAGWVMITAVLLFGYVATWYTGLKYVKVSVAATILLLASPITTLLSVLFLDGSLAVNQILGISLIFTALGIIYFYVGKERKSAIVA
ncbi:MAG: DMT family transporter [Candidatus Portnoybacteria bacterium]|nr:DMT family transporter [Candidatus Portnoybacteria bacterium]